MHQAGTGGRIVGFTNGCFDLTHAGHRHLLTYAQAHCDELHVAINTDASVRHMKGMERPIDPLWVRAVNVGRIVPQATLHTIDTEAELWGLIEKIKPAMIFKGADYHGKRIVGSDIAQAIMVPMLPGISTTALLRA